jgi:chromosome segregation ATPase
MALKLYLMLIIIGILSVVGFSAYKYYKDSQETIRILTANNAKLEIAVATNEEAIDSLQTNYAAAQSRLTELNSAYTSIRRQNQELAEKLQKIDLTAAALANPTAIERAVNRGTENAGRCFELLSGAPLTTTEKEAKDDISFNKECPWLYNDYKSRGLLNETPAAGTGN